MDCNGLDELSIREQSLTNESEFSFFEVLETLEVELSMAIPCQSCNYCIIFLLNMYKIMLNYQRYSLIRNKKAFWFIICAEIADTMYSEPHFDICIYIYIFFFQMLTKW
jgi:hypothetical protein